jgi:hypothetical protein
MSSQEIVFWISLFGLDFGVPLMLPEWLRFRIGALATGLSLTGLMWSLGYRPLSPHVGWRAAMVFIGMGAASLLLANFKRERELPLLIYDAAEIIQLFITRAKRDHTGADSSVPNVSEADWRKVIGRYRRNPARLALSLIQETAIPDRDLVKLVKNPQTFQDMQDCVARLNRLADLLYQGKGRLMRLAVNLLAGGILGAAAFGGFRFIVEKFQL